MNREVRVGLMFVIALGVLGTTFYFLGSFQETVKYKIQFGKVNGLEVDSPVHFNGVPIGRVTKIVLSEEVEVSHEVPIIVTIAIHRSARNHIRASTQADIRSIGVLGDRFILLVTKNYENPVLEEGGFIKPVPKALDVEKLLEQGTDLVTDVTEITEDLKLVLERLAHGDGTLQRIIQDPQMADNLSQAVDRILAYLQNDQSLLALMLSDPEFATKVKTRMETILDDLAGLTRDYRQGTGLLPALLGDEDFKKQVQQKMLHMLDAGNAYVDSMNQSKGLLYKLSQDEAYAERVSENLEKASYHLASILEKIDEGDGSAALAINDPSLYEGLYEVVYGLQHSGLSKWYIRKKQRKGSKLKDKENPNEEEQK